MQLLSKKKIGVFALAMMNVAAVGSIRGWPVIAEYGLSSLAVLLLVSVGFFLPISLVAAELSTGWPKAGGIFSWVKEAFGYRMGFLAIWLLWIENVIWSPTLLAFISSTIAYTIDPALAENRLYTTLMVLALFWFVTYLNMRSTKMASRLSTLAALLGTLLPALLIIALGIVGYCSGNIPAFSQDSWLPSCTHLSEFAFLAGVFLSFAGMEMSAVHAQDVDRPQKSFPRAILLSALMIILMTSLGSLSIASVIPKSEMSLVSGTMQAFFAFLKPYNLSSLVPLIAILMAFGAIGSLSAWAGGPTKGLSDAALAGKLPAILSSQKSLMLLQAVIVSVLSLLFIFLPTVSHAYWALTALVANLYLIMYVLLFVTAIKLRKKRADVIRAYTIPGGKVGIYFVGLLGIGSSTFCLITGLLPPPSLALTSPTLYLLFMSAGVALFCILPLLVLRAQREQYVES